MGFTSRRRDTKASFGAPEYYHDRGLYYVRQDSCGSGTANFTSLAGQKVNTDTILAQFKEKRRYFVSVVVFMKAVSLIITAERQGFEPWVPKKEQRFSRPPRSTAPAPLQFLFIQRFNLVLYLLSILIIIIHSQYLNHIYFEDLHILIYLILIIFAIYFYCFMIISNESVQII